MQDYTAALNEAIAAAGAIIERRFHGSFTVDHKEGINKPRHGSR